jgi:predicted transcriptional regulator
MKEEEIISWVFLATAFASRQGLANIESISEIADGINHAVPTNKELQMSLKWLAVNGLIEKQVKRYLLTIAGSETIIKAETRTNNFIMNIWKELTKEIENLKPQ